jgi:O-antigen ligase/polysaccharide polymerase Wzy-like membrane protein
MGAARRPALRARRVAASGLLVAIAALLAAAVFAGDGSRDDALATVGVAAILAAAAALVTGWRGLLPLRRLDRPGVAVVVGATALAAWAGLSIAWSIAGDRSLEWLARGLVYLAFLALGLAGGALASGARRLAAIVAVVVAAALAWALLGVAVPSLFEDGDRIARLREPVGYWNALALLADGGLALGLWLGRSRRLELRVCGLLLAYGATVALLLTQSRAGIAGALAVLALWLVASDHRLADALRALLAVLPGAAVAGWAFTRPALVEDGVLRADRVVDGRTFAALVLAGGLVVALAACGLPVTRLVVERARLVRGVLAVACAALLVAGVAGVAASVGEPLSWASSQLAGEECTNDPGRLTDLCANNRPAWWRESLRIAEDRPLAGSGAGTFAIARKRVREDASSVSEPHSVPLQLLADLGAVGLGLGLVVIVGAIVGVRRGLRSADERQRPAAVALACLVLAYGVHALVDYDLDFLAVTAPMLVALGGLLALGRPPTTMRLGWASLAALLATAVAAVVVVALPALAERDVERSLDASDAGRVEDAVDAAERARQLNPLALGPLEALAVAADADGNERLAVAWYERATELQPENPDTWYALGLYHSLATGDRCAAYTALNASYTLDPHGSRWVPGGPLDVTRDAVNAGACER